MQLLQLISAGEEGIRVELCGTSDTIVSLKELMHERFNILLEEECGLSLDDKWQSLSASDDGILTIDGTPTNMKVDSYIEELSVKVNDTSIKMNTCDANQRQEQYMYIITDTDTDDQQNSVK